MKKQFIILYPFVLLFLMCCSNINAQSSEVFNNRIKDIKKWYAEIQAIGLKNCNSKSYIKYESPYSSEEKANKIPFNQTISECILNNTYKLRKGQFRGYEWNEDVMVYFKNGKVFFVFVKGNSEGYSYERRIYCSANEQIIQQLDREADSGEELNKVNKENYRNINKNIREVIDVDAYNNFQDYKLNKQ